MGRDVAAVRAIVSVPADGGAPEGA
jgi:hypothetical protein